LKKLHLICNAHIDPVWLWEWEEGAAAAISTFRVAADFCEQFEGFVFNHNEVTLYKWVEEYEPELFKRIQCLVKEGKWHIMGGWYLQPDCNMSSGESLVRQILVGRKYFEEKFGAKPTTAINFDPFGHSRGLVQIMKKAGYDSYIFCRPYEEDCHLEAETFIWVGFDGSEVMAQRLESHYNSALGEADKKVEKCLEEQKQKQINILLWGVGNHGGGPSRIDLQKLKILMEENKETKIIHSIPENYFKEIAEEKERLPKHEKDLNPWAVGCYTSQIRIKQKHRLLENEYYMTEKILAHAAVAGYIAYPKLELDEALYDLLESEFHDILPGSGIQPVEESSFRVMDHGLKILSSLKARAFFALSNGSEKAKEGEIPILVYNPHPYPIKGIFECEFQLADQNWSDTFTMPILYQNGEKIPTQVEKELSNLNLDWRKRISFYAELKPSSMNRFDCQLEILPKKLLPFIREENGMFVFKTDEIEVHINTHTGLIDKYAVAGKDYLKKEAFLPIVMEDNEDPWAMRVQCFRKVKGAFKLMSKEEGSKFSGITQGVLDSVRVVEDGTVRTVIEAVFKYDCSYICQTYKLPKQGTELEVETRVQWAQKDEMLKLAIPTLCPEGIYKGQVAYGVDNLRHKGEEVVAHKWTAMIDEKQNLAVTCINDGIYGSDFCDGEIRLSLLRSSAYAAHPILERSIVPQDRFTPRIDQGERIFRFWIQAGKANIMMEAVDRIAMAHNEKPFILSFFPSGQGEVPKPLIEIDDVAVQLNAFKQCEHSSDYIIRISETTGKKITTKLKLPIFEYEKEIDLGPFEIKTLKWDNNDCKLTQVELMEANFKDKI